MQISYEWLMDFFPERIEIDELSQILTDIGLEVEAIEKIEQVKGNLEGVVVGEVITCDKHPNADKLKVTTVNVGTDTLLNIVCGAPNVAAGQKVLVATIGTTLYGDPKQPLHIKGATIRGVASEGMLCAEDELGIGNSHDGIMVLPSDVAVGTLASEYLALPAPSTAIHIGLTPNRSDAMSHIGVARDVAAYLNHHKGSEITIRNIDTPDIQVPTQPRHISVSVLDADRCPRYAGVTIDGVKVAPSPSWMQEKLISAGLRPINNVVDITNIVLLEMGQPLHAFDLDTIEGDIVIKTFPKDTPFVTLDGKERKLSDKDLMIADSNKPICIAGVMGGATSGVSDSTTHIFLESAYFHPKSIRNTSILHGLRTDAALRFEKNANVDMVIPALNRAVTLILEWCGGQVSSSIIDIYQQPIAKQQVSFQYGAIASLCGKSYSKASIDSILEDLGFEIINSNELGATVAVPHSKNDISQMADIAEEIIRIDGLNNIPVSNRFSFSHSKGSNKTSTHRKYKQLIANWLTANGLNEIITNSIIDSQSFDKEQGIVTMINSLSSELNAMRPDMILSGLEVIQYNQNRKNADLALYEIGNVYRKSENGYQQEEQLCIWMTGERLSSQWMTQAVPYDFYYLKGILDSLLTYCGVHDVKRMVEDDSYVYKYRNQTLATITVVNKKWLKIADVKQKVYYAVIHTSLLIQAIDQSKIKYQEVNKFPSVSRDLAIILDKKVTYDTIMQATRRLKLKDLASFQLFDIYEGASIGEDNRSWAINYVFEAKEKTFTDQEIDQMMSSIMNVYSKELGATIRK